MITVPEQLVALGKAQVEATLKFAAAAADGAEKLADLQIKGVKSAFEDGIKNAKALTSVKDFSELSGWTGAHFQPGLDKATAYARGFYEATTATQSEISAILEGQVADFNRNVALALEAALKSAPAGSGPAVDAVKAVLDTANSVYESITKASKQLATLTEANIATATAPVPATGKKKAA